MEKGRKALNLACPSRIQKIVDLAMKVPLKDEKVPLNVHVPLTSEVLPDVHMAETLRVKVSCNL